MYFRESECGFKSVSFFNETYQFSNDNITFRLGLYLRILIDISLKRNHYIYKELYNNASKKHNLFLN